MFVIWHAAWTALAHKNPGTDLSSKKHLVMSNMEWFLHSATPF